MMTDAIGWVSSLLLLATIVAQIRKQWSERSGEGVSAWLFIGQTAASLGFTIYSFMLKNWVFTVTNSLMLVSAIVGWQMTARFKSAAKADDRFATGGPRAAQLGLRKTGKSEAG